MKTGKLHAYTSFYYCVFFFRSRSLSTSVKFPVDSVSYIYWCRYCADIEHMVREGRIDSINDF